MTNDKILEIAAMLTHSYFLNEFCIAQSKYPKAELRNDSENVVKDIFKQYIQEIIKNPQEYLKP